MKHLPWILLALVLAFPLFAQGQNPISVFRVSLVGSVPLDMRVPGQPLAKDIVRIVEGVPYTVPDAMILVMTGLGHSAGSFTGVLISVDGVMVWVDRILAGSNGIGTPDYSFDIPHPGITAGAGSVVTVDVWSSGGATFGVLIGYLEKE